MRALLVVVVAALASGAATAQTELTLRICRDTKITSALDRKPIVVPEGTRFVAWTKFGSDGAPSGGQVELVVTKRIPVGAATACVTAPAEIHTNASGRDVSAADRRQFREAGLLKPPRIAADQSQPAIDETGMAELIATILPR